MKLLSTNRRAKIVKAEASLFLPDNFSRPEISYRPIEASDMELLSAITKKFFINARVMGAWQLNGIEVNSNNYQISLEQDSKRRKILLRRFKFLRGPEQIDFYLRLIKHLGDQSVKVSRVIPDREGRLYVEYGEFKYAAFDFIDGQHFVPNEAGFSAVASAIAAMHAAFSALDESMVAHIDKLSVLTGNYFNKYKHYSSEDFYAVHDAINRKAEKTESDLAVLSRIPLFLDTVAEVKEYEDDVKKLGKQVIHSDLHPHNILMNGDRVGAIVDFDSVRFSQRARDVAFAIYRFGRQFFVADNSYAKKEAPQLVELFIDSYGIIKKLSEKEIESLPILVKDEFLKKILFVLNGVYTESNFAWAKDLKKFLAAIDEINYFWPKK